MIQYTGKFCIIMLLTLPLYLLVRRPWRREAKRKWAMALFNAVESGAAAGGCLGVALYFGLMRHFLRYYTINM